ncbi:group III truncated hemoglobin [Polaribacter undariae]|uniref:Group III truncated hemoglobin n=1 Tax=Polaribacter sejongensis TaxID=985043 RepID=A0AAJ1VHD0_9FLAO|nr:group III truncated hemoglobin [Polaribacter undariae]MDN3620204.1 group III truncated hemoglobin [Polaribacter undariae]UWD32605.1 group III truncated hemoglobin [Polaribacter undariae]
MKEIENRADINLLVITFYNEVRKDALLGPIFNHHLKAEQWPPHLEKLTDFWVTALLGDVCFKGNPTKAHLEVDKHLKHTMSQEHFGQWLQIWFQTIDSLYVGDVAQRAKDASRRMATGQYLNVWKSREV